MYIHVNEIKVSQSNVYPCQLECSIIFNFLSFIPLHVAAAAAVAAAKSLQSCPTLCDPTDGSPPSSDVPGILQSRTLEWAAISFSTLHIETHQMQFKSQ